MKTLSLFSNDTVILCTLPVEELISFLTGVLGCSRRVSVRAWRGFSHCWRKSRTLPDHHQPKFLREFRIRGRRVVLLWAPRGVSEKVSALPWKEIPGSINRHCSEAHGFAVYDGFVLSSSTMWRFPNGSFTLHSLTTGLYVEWTDLAVTAGWERIPVSFQIDWFAK